MNDAERTILVNILGHIRLAAQGQQAAYTQLKMAEEKMQRLLGQPDPLPPAPAPAK